MISTPIIDRYLWQLHFPSHKKYIGKEVQVWQRTATIEGTGALWRETEEAGLVQPREWVALGNTTAVPSDYKDDIKKMEPGSLQQCMKMRNNRCWNKRNSEWRKGETFSPWQLFTSRTDCSYMLWGPPILTCFQNLLMQTWTTWTEHKLPLVWAEGWPRDLLRSLPSWDFLWPCALM